MKAIWDSIADVQPLHLPTLMHPGSSISYKFLFHVPKQASYAIFFYYLNSP